MAPLIYLASPYSHPSAAVRRERYEANLALTAVLLREGLAVFSPIVYGHQLEDTIGIDFQSWQPLNDTMIRKADRFGILRLPGWEQSRGVTHEVALWHKLHGPEITYFDWG